MKKDIKDIEIRVHKMHTSCILSTSIPVAEWQDQDGEADAPERGNDPIWGVQFRY